MFSNENANGSHLQSEENTSRRLVIDKATVTYSTAGSTTRATQPLVESYINFREESKKFLELVDSRIFLLYMLGFR